jgi:hypothetical protein
MQASCGLWSLVLLQPAQKINLINQFGRRAISNAPFQRQRKHRQLKHQQCRVLPSRLTYLARHRQLERVHVPRITK